MAQRAVVIDHFDAVDAGVQHVLLDRERLNIFLALQHLRMDVGRREVPAGLQRHAVLPGVKRQHKPTVGAAAIAQACLAGERGEGHDRLAPLRRQPLAIVGVKGIEPVSGAVLTVHCAGIVAPLFIKVAAKAVAEANQTG